MWSNGRKAGIGPKTEQTLHLPPLLISLCLPPSPEVVSLGTFASWQCKSTWAVRHGQTWDTKPKHPQKVGRKALLFQMQKAQFTQALKFPKRSCTEELSGKQTPNMFHYPLSPGSELLSVDKKPETLAKNGRLYTSTKENIKTHCWENKVKSHLWMMINQRGSSPTGGFQC